MRADHFASLHSAGRPLCTALGQLLQDCLFPSRPRRAAPHGPRARRPLCAPHPQLHWEPQHCEPPSIPETFWGSALSLPCLFLTILQLLSQRLCLAFLYLVCGSSRIVAPTRFLFWPFWHRTLTPGTPPPLQFLFNGGDEKTVAFINRYYGFDIKPVPVRLSQFSQIA
jgi:hypothetical protein